MISENDDDVWASDEEYEKTISLKEWDRMNHNFGNIGYKEGIIEGKDVTIQEGFNKGYVEGANIGLEFGRLRGLLNTLLEFYRPLMDENNSNNSNNEFTIPNQSTFSKLNSLEDDLASLTADKVFTKDYFQITNQFNPCKDDCGCLSDTTNTEKDSCCSKNLTSENKDEEIQNRENIKSNENLAEKLLMEYKEKVNLLLEELGFDKDSDSI